MKTRHDEIREQTIEYHKKYPQVWELFCAFTFEQIKKGFKNYSVSAIFERIRWQTDVPDVDGESTFKLNNNYRSFYSRAFMKRYPQHGDFFRTREQNSKGVPATNLPELTPENFK
jgi:hypothetical protein